MAKWSFRKKGLTFYSLYSPEEKLGHVLKQGGLEAGLKQMPRRRAAYWLSGSCSATFLTPPRTTCPEVAPSTLSWALPQQVINQENAPQASLKETVSQLRFFFLRLLEFRFIEH